MLRRQLKKEKRPAITSVVGVFLRRALGRAVTGRYGREAEIANMGVGAGIAVLGN